MSEQPLIQTPSFDQIVKGNVFIKKLSKDKYRITFSKIGKFLLYQVWDKDSVNLNKKRSVGYVSAKEWIKAFRGYNKELDNNDEPLFTPTTIMETEDDCNYAFVIHKAYLNSCGNVVFTVSTEEISLRNNSSKKLVRLPEGKCNNMRFDIDNYLQGMNLTNTCYSENCLDKCLQRQWTLNCNILCKLIKDNSPPCNPT